MIDSLLGVVDSVSGISPLPLFRSQESSRSRQTTETQLGQQPLVNFPEVNLNMFLLLINIYMICPGLWSCQRANIYNWIFVNLRPQRKAYCKKLKL